jgi:hypothetical protein
MMTIMLEASPVQVCIPKLLMLLLLLHPPLALLKVGLVINKTEVTRKPNSFLHQLTGTNILVLHLPLLVGVACE